MSSLDFYELPDWVRERIESHAKTQGISVDRAMVDILIEGIAMGGLTSAGRPKARVVQLRPGEGLKRG